MKKLIDKGELKRRLNDKTSICTIMDIDYFSKSEVYGIIDEMADEVKPATVNPDYAAEADELHDDIYEAIGLMKTVSALKDSEDLSRYIESLSERLMYSLKIMMDVLKEGLSDGDR